MALASALGPPFHFGFFPTDNFYQMTNVKVAGAIHRRSSIATHSPSTASGVASAQRRAIVDKCTDLWAADLHGGRTQRKDNRGPRMLARMRTRRASCRPGGGRPSSPPERPCPGSGIKGGCFSVYCTVSLLGEKGEAGAISRPLGALPLSAVGEAR